MSVEDLNFMKFDCQNSPFRCPKSIKGLPEQFRIFTGEIYGRHDFY